MGTGCCTALALAQEDAQLVVEEIKRGPGSIRTASRHGGQSVIRPPWDLMLCCAASRIRTTRRPASPSVNGRLFSAMRFDSRRSYRLALMRGCSESNLPGGIGRSAIWPIFLHKRRFLLAAFREIRTTYARRNHGNPKALSRRGVGYCRERL